MSQYYCNQEGATEVTKKEFEIAKKDKIKQAVSKLSKLHGVQVAIALGILAIKFPESYCVINNNMLRELHKNGMGKFLL